MHERISTLLERLEIKSRIFYAGTLCSLVHFDAEEGVGHFHLLKEGRLKLKAVPGPELDITEPTLIFFPRSTHHHLDAGDAKGADLVCASVKLGSPLANPLLQCLPTPLVLPLREAPAIAMVLDALFAEAFDTRYGGMGAALDRLCEVVLIYLLRHAAEAGLLRTGVVAGLADTRLAKALDAIHKEPARPWTLDALASLAGMSRARFAAHFATVVGQPAIQYLSDRRLTTAQNLLAQGRQVKSIADEVGYGSPNALTRAFTQRVGQSPTEWVAQRAFRGP